ncbi:hypothetical protein [Alkalihalobacillus sp. R86527]|uniref:TcaA NTF2-like domain-containing protein n=1 Tax=Alkalihalobacillus sp. R86527 TaxID=3093863 RepID=UPI0036718BE2
MKIEGYEVINTLFKSDEGLEVFEVIDSSSKEKHILRIADYSKQESLQESWFAIYDDYQSKVTNYKYLPRVLSVTMVDGKKVMAVLKCDEGQLLRSEKSISLDQVYQLMDAVHHLHKRKLIHGSITANNIWVNENDSIVLYGTNEKIAFDSEHQGDERSDVNQLIEIINIYSNIDKKILRVIENKKPTTIGDLELLLKDPSIEVKKQKSGLVEKEVIEANVDLETKKNVPIVERKKKKRDLEANREVEQPPIRSERNRNKKSKKKPLLIGGTLVIIILTIIFTNMYNNGVENQPEAIQVNTIEEAPADTEVDNEDDVLEAPPEEVVDEPVIEENPIPTFSDREIKHFMDQYSALTINAINQQNFSLVERMIDPDGEMYQEQLDYIEYLSGKDISEKLLFFRIDDVERIDETTYKINTYEEYDIVYGVEGTQKVKSFNSAYLLKVMENNNLGVNKLLFTDEVSSEDIVSSEPEVVEEEIEEEPVVNESVSQEDLEYFIQQYGNATIDAIRMNDFSYVEHYLDPYGKSYKESKEYISYLNEKNISEDLLTLYATETYQLNDNTYQVNTYEEYDITYGDGSVKFKSFNSQYKVKQIEGYLYISELIDTKEVESREY